MASLKATTLDDLLASIRDKARIYASLAPEEKAEVDAYTAKLQGKSIMEILALGENPMKKYIERERERGGA